jgi:histidine ammonia-lyase
MPSFTASFLFQIDLLYSPFFRMVQAHSFLYRNIIKIIQTKGGSGFSPTLLSIEHSNIIKGESDKMAANQTVKIKGDELNFSQFSSVVFEKTPVALDDEAIKRMQASRDFVERLIQNRETVYGITTGFGQLCNRFIDPGQASRLQHHLIQSHACGTGEPLPEPVVRGMMLLRINALAKGYSGIRPSTVQALVTLLNREVYPVIPSQGSLGASGDLVPLAHMCLPLLGRGEVMHQGKRKPASDVLKEIGLTPLKLEAKEGLAFINGTQMMCSLGALAVMEAKKLLLAADIIACMTLEALEGIPHAFHPRLQQVRGQSGQMVTADNLRKLLQGSECISKPGGKRVQDAYSLRCIPQVHGASKDAFHYVEEIVLREMNAATDNPLLFADEEEVVSGGNFHGQPLALALDFLTMAMAEIANISERRTERLVNPQLSGLPPFLVPNGGLNSGYMIFQYVAASLVSENKTLSHPASVDSIPSSGNQEDHVSMGAISARKCRQVIENTRKVLAIEYLCAAQALEFQSKKPGRSTRLAYDLLRQSVPPLEEDREGYREIEWADHLIQSGQLTSLIQSRIGLKV